MPTQYMVTDTELTAVADAIRTKGGTSEDLEWYSGFVSAIGDISGGSIPSPTSITLENGGFDPNGKNQNSSPNTRVRSTGFVECDISKMYILKAVPAEGYTLKLSVSFYADDDFTINRLSYLGFEKNTILGFVPPSGATYFRVTIGLDNDGSMTTSNVSSCVYFEFDENLRGGK